MITIILIILFNNYKFKIKCNYLIEYYNNKNLIDCKSLNIFPSRNYPKDNSNNCWDLISYTLQIIKQINDNPNGNYITNHGVFMIEYDYYYEYYFGKLIDSIRRFKCNGKLNIKNKCSKADLSNCNNYYSLEEDNNYHQCINPIENCKYCGYSPNICRIK